MDRVHVMQLVQQLRWGQLTRRAFLEQSTVAVGSVTGANLLLVACAATPSTAPNEPVVQGTQQEEPEVVTGEGIITTSVQYRGSSGETLSGYLARPSGDEARPAVIVIQEWWGVNDHIKDVTRRFAREGYVALAPDLYHGVVVSEPDEARKMVMELDMEDAVREIRDAVDYLQQQSYVGRDKVGIVGFCMGGGLVLQTATQEEDLGAAVAFYGTPLSSSHAKQVKAPVLGLFGEEDTGIPTSSIRVMEAALDEAGIENEIHIYEDAGHSFFNDTRPSYVPTAAEDAWQRTLTWLDEKLNS